jgi:RNA polymerase sigma-70 factor (ECF subfamily)
VAAWLVTIARNRAIDRVRSRSTRLRTEEPIEGHTYVPDASPNPEQATAASRRRLRMEAAMASLTPEQREAIDLAFFSGFTHSELAGRLGLPLGTVKTRIRSGMMKLREQPGEPAE